MIDIRKVLGSFLLYYDRNHRAGHTTLALKGVLNTQTATFVSAHPTIFRNRVEADSSDGQNYRRVVGLDAGGLLLAGRQGPIAFDNSAIEAIFRAALDEITRLDEENRAFAAQYRKSFKARGLLMAAQLAQNLSYKSLKLVLETETDPATRTKLEARLRALEDGDDE